MRNNYIYFTLIAIDVIMFKVSAMSPYYGVTENPKGMMPEPPYELGVIFGHKLNYFAHAGNRLTASQVYLPPFLHWKADNSTFYAVVLLDEDVPTEEFPSFRSAVHWFVGNIPGSAMISGMTLLKYFPPAPPRKLGTHRFPIFVFEQIAKVNYNALLQHFEDRINHINFSVKKFMDRYKIKSIVASNYFVMNTGNSSVLEHEAIYVYNRYFKLIPKI